MKIILGLGNPGKEYERTRHNVGFLIADELAQGEKFIITKKLFSDVAKTELGGKRAIVAKPATYMNDSGRAAAALLSFYKLTPNDLIVVHDEKDIPLGETRIQRDRGSAGHNGIKSIIEHLGTKDFTRIRVGVAPTDGTTIPDTANFVLGNFTKEEQKILKTVIDHVATEIRVLITA